MSTASTASATESAVITFLGDQRAVLALSLKERIGRVKAMHEQSSKMMEKLRCFAQPNPAFRGERLVASAMNLVSDRQQYATVLKDASLAAFDNIKPLVEYVDEMASAMQAIAGFQDVYLRQVQVYGVKKLNDFVSTDYPRIMDEYKELEKRLEKYEIARAKKGITLQQAHQQLMEQALLLEASLEQTAKYQLEFCKAVDLVVRGETQYFKEIKSIVDAVKGPDYKKRWGNK